MAGYKPDKHGTVLDEADPADVTVEPGASGVAPWPKGTRLHDPEHGPLRLAANEYILRQLPDGRYLIETVASSRDGYLREKGPEDCEDPRQPGCETEPAEAPLEERRRCAAMGMALQDREIIQGRDLLDKTRQSTDALIAEAKKIEAYLRGDQ